MISISKFAESVAGSRVSGRREVAIVGVELLEMSAYQTRR